MRTNKEKSERVWEFGGCISFWTIESTALKSEARLQLNLCPSKTSNSKQLSEEELSARLLKVNDIIKVYFRYRSSWLRESGRRPSVPLRLLKRRFVFRRQLAQKRLSLLSRWSLRTTTSTSRCWKEMFLPLAAVVVASNAGCDDNNEDSSIMNDNQSQSYYESKMARNHCHHHFHLWPPRFLTGLHASFQDNERLFFVMDFLGGGDLMHHMMQVSLENPEEIQIPRVNDLENQEPDSTLQRSSLLSSSSTTRLARLAPYHKARRYWLRELWCWPHIGRFFSSVFRWFCWFALLCLLYDIHVSKRGCLPSWIISRDKRLKVNEAVKVRESLIIKNMRMLKFWAKWFSINITAVQLHNMYMRVRYIYRGGRVLSAFCTAHH